MLAIFIFVGGRLAPTPRHTASFLASGGKFCMKLAAVGHDNVAELQISDHQALLPFSQVERDKQTQTGIQTVLILFTWF
jgi:hypothetical protein